MKSERNKTIVLTGDEEGRLLSLCTPLDKLGEDIRNTVIHGDSLTAMPLLPRAFADLIICDPPYNLTKDYNGELFTKMRTEEYEAFTVAWLEKAAPLLKKTGSIYVCCDWRSSLVIGRVLADYFTVRNRITWQREKGRGAAANWKNSMEDIWFATASDSYTFNLNDVKIRRRVTAPYTNQGVPKDWEKTAEGNFRNTCPSNFWDDITVPFWSMSENTEHPAQKPEKLAARLILASSDPGDMVFDPFAGSGTSAAAAKKLGRDYCVIERNGGYCALTQKRLALAQEDSTIQGYKNGVFTQRNSR